MFGFTKARRVLAEVLAEIEAMRADVVGFDDEVLSPWTWGTAEEVIPMDRDF